VLAGDSLTVMKTDTGQWLKIHNGDLFTDTDVEDVHHQLA